MKNFFKSKKKVAATIGLIVGVTALFHPKSSIIVEIVGDAIVEIFYNNQTELENEIPTTDN